MSQQHLRYSVLPQCEPVAATNGFETPLLAWSDIIEAETLIEAGGVRAEANAVNFFALSNFCTTLEETDSDGPSDTKSRVAHVISQVATLTFNYVSVVILGSIASSLYSTLAPFFGWMVFHVLSCEPYASHGGVIICAGMIGAPILASGLITIAWTYKALEAVYETVFEIHCEPRARQLSRHGEQKPKLAHRYRGAVYMSCSIVGVVVCGILSPAVGLPIFNKLAKPDVIFSPAQGIICAIVGLAFVLTVVFLCAAMYNVLRMTESRCNTGEDSRD